MTTPINILKKYWGYSSFRPFQEEIIQSVIDSKNTLAILPTGGGKSICYHVPALLNDGICIVISPLISLMNDQVLSLKKRNIKAAMLKTGMSTDDLVQIFDTLKFDHYKFLYLSPERLQNEFILQKFEELNINLIAIDEAHCISEWGHDFRPAYKLLNKIVQRFSKPVIAVTATATKKVQEDIIHSLGFESPAVFIQSFERANLNYAVLKKEDKLGALLNLLDKHSGSSIIYTSSRKKTEEVAVYLNQKGITSSFYHGGLSKEIKEDHYNSWIQGTTRVMVATNAFGMGIDKEDVSLVLHLDIPFSIENYTQEAGRAGRNGKQAHAIILSNSNDILFFKQSFQKSLPDINFIKKVYQYLFQYFQIGLGELNEQVFEFNTIGFCEQYQLPVLKTTNALQLLKSYSIIDINSSALKKSEIQFLVSSHQLQNYPKEQQILIDFLLRAYGGIFQQTTKINEFWIAKKIGTTSSKVIQLLQKMEREEIISYKKVNEEASLQFLLPREDDKTINRISKELKNYLINKTEKAASIIRYIETDSVCRNKMLLSYFDERKDEKCGQCDFCLSSRSKLPIDLSRIVNTLEGVEAKSIQEISSELQASEKDILIHLRKLLSEDKIGIDHLNKFYLK